MLETSEVVERDAGVAYRDAGQGIDGRRVLACDRSQMYKVVAITDANENDSVLKAVWNCRSLLTYMTSMTSSASFGPTVP